MLIDIDILSIVLLESFGIISFLLALVFFRQSRKISDKQESLKKTATDEIWNGSCYSYKWVMSHSMKQKKLLAATPALALLLALLGAVWMYGIGPHVFSALIGLGYASLIALIGVAVFLFETNAYEAYGYSKAIQEVSLDDLDWEDKSYMELAKEALENATARFLIIGIIFAVTGPLIPQIIDSLIYALITYTKVAFLISEEISLFLAFLIVAIFSAILLYLPELMGRTIFRRVKLLAQRIWEHWRKR